MDFKIRRKIQQVLEKGAKGEDYDDIKTINEYNSNEDKMLNQFIVVLKPEITAINKDSEVQEILDDISSVFDTYSVKIGGIKILSAEYLKKNKVLEKMYVSLYSISLTGFDACSLEVKKKLRCIVDSENIPLKNILGSYQFLDKFTQFTPLSLETMSRNVMTEKLGNGCYYINISVNGENFIVMNPFHPHQREWFHSVKSSIVIFECTSNTDFRKIREGCIGSLDPSNSKEGSLKKILNDKNYGVGNINVAYNGYHVSPGPIEALRNILYFFLDNDFTKLNQTSLGKTLLNLGVKTEQIVNIINNSKKIGNKQLNQSIFDSTEFMNNSEVITYIKELLIDLEGRE
ncbi:hypothetical protein DOK67_0000676 [Enterococcus sp. DIV0212c]|uniref:hypothetical protein n=1 Tax=Enterococcus sp. DIV0212c TaxID=2230867 RepID=UPI001A9A90DE|nr:hypothetical protein [Enterococcus sp. DIV0212c]MBO1354673.1 hypothetical protein [Enterococcus sp. DIV0212c]